MNKNKLPIKKLGIGKRIAAGAALTLAGALAPHEAASAQDATPPPTEQPADVSTTDTTEASATTSSTSTTSTTEVPTTQTTLVESTTTTTAQETGQNPLVCDPETNTTVPTGEFDPLTGNPIFKIYGKEGNLCGTTVDPLSLTQDPPAQVEQLPRTGNSLEPLGLASAGLIAAGGLAVAEAAKRRNAQTPNS